MNDKDEQAQHRLEHASREVLQNTLAQTEQQLKAHQSSANDTHQTRAQRERAATKAEECKARIEQIHAEKKRRAEAEHMAIASKPYQTKPPEKSGQAAFDELMRLEDNLTRAELHAIEYGQLASNAKSEKERTDQTMRAQYWKQRAVNARSRIEEFILMHKDDAYKPWLDQDEPGTIH